MIVRGLSDVPMAAVTQLDGDPKKVCYTLSERFEGTSTLNKASIHTAIAKMWYTGQVMEQCVATDDKLVVKSNAMSAPIDESLFIILLFQSFITEAEYK